MKRGISFLLVILMVASLGTTIFATASDKDIQGTVRYYSGHDDLSQDFETSFTYSDDYFSGSSYEYRQNLAEASLAMAFGAFSSREAEVQVNEDQNWISMMSQIGFSSCASNEWYRQVPEHDSIGVCCAKKEITILGKTSTVIAVGIRGNYYRCEWGGNMNVGESGDHAGWTLCKEQVLSFVSQYIAKEKITGDVKLWMAGYSRSAATANLTAAALDDGYVLSEKINLPLDQIYCYCFEAPAPTVNPNARDAKYSNIQNVLNENDVVTYVPFSSWGFTRYGVDRYVPVEGDANYETYLAAMKADLDTIPNNGGGYLVDDFKYIHYDSKRLRFVEDTSMSQKEYYVLLEKALATDFAFSRKDYVENLQPYLIEILGIIFNRNNLDFDAAFSIFSKKMQANSLKMAGIIFSFRINKQQELTNLFSILIFESLNEAGITNFNEKELKSALAAVLPRLSNMAIKNPDVTITLLKNATIIISAHYAELCMAWTRSLPDDYLSEKKEETVTPVYEKCAIEVSAVKEETSSSLISKTSISVKETVKTVLSPLKKIFGKK